MNIGVMAVADPISLSAAMSRTPGSLVDVAAVVVHVSDLDGETRFPNRFREIALIDNSK